MRVITSALSPVFTPMAQIPESLLSEMLPRAIAWAEEQEAFIAQQGTPLNEAGVELARRAGVRQPERIRLLPVESVPLPEEEDLKRAALDFGLITKDTSGMTVGYGIFLLKRLWTAADKVSLQLGRVYTILSASTMRANDRNARKTTSSFSKREKMRRKPFSLRKSRSISLRFL
jgi:hypothetical protein